MPASSRLLITYVGRALDERWANEARSEMAQNPRYRWLGNVPLEQVFQLLATARLMVLSSIMEGGANVTGEALAAGAPVLASDIDRSGARLGADYPGLYPVCNPTASATPSVRAQTDPAFSGPAHLPQRCPSVAVFTRTRVRLLATADRHHRAKRPSIRRSYQQ